jgi:hypothetical protein
MPIYHFSLGDSTSGAIGFCAAVRAKSRKEAVALLRSGLPEEIPVVRSRKVPKRGVEYVQVYLNLERIDVKHVEFIEER